MDLRNKVFTGGHSQKNAKSKLEQFSKSLCNTKIISFFQADSHSSNPNPFSSLFRLLQIQNEQFQRTKDLIRRKSLNFYLIEINIRDFEIFDRAKKPRIFPNNIFDKNVALTFNRAYGPYFVIIDILSCDYNIQ